MKNTRKYFVVGLLSLSIFWNISYGQAVQSTSDIPSSWAAQAIEESVLLSYIPEELQSGYQSEITRYEFAKVSLYFLVAQYNYYGIDGIEASSFLKRFLPSTRGNGVAIYSKEDIIELVPIEKRERYEPEYYSTWAYLLHNIEPFSDVENDLYINAAYILGIIQGRDDGSFGPDDFITRQEAAAMLTRVYRIYGNETALQSDAKALNDFSDLESIADWAKESVSLMVTYQIMKGVGNGEFSPDGCYTKEQCYCTFMRLYESMPISRLNKNVERFSTLEEDISSIQGGAFYVSSSTRYENDDIVLIVAHYGGLPHGGSYNRFFICNKDGGMRAIVVPGALAADNFTVLRDEGELLSFFVSDHTYQLNLFSGELRLTE